MRWKTPSTILLTLLFIQHTKADIKPSLCCPPEPSKLISPRKCANGNDIKLTCEKAFLIDVKDAETTLEGNSVLIMEGTKFQPDSYCFGNLNNSSYYLICFTEDNIEEVTTSMNKVTLIISIIFLVLTIAVYFIVPNLLDLQGKCMIHSIGGLAIAYIILDSISFSRHIESVACTGLAFGLYFFFMYAIFWQNVLSFHIWRTTLSPSFLNRFNNWTMIYHVYGIFSPFLLLTLMIILHHSDSFKTSPLHPGFGESSCWFRTLSLSFLYFYLPLSLLLGINLILYLWTIIYVWKILSDSDAIKTKVLKYRLKMCFKLFFIMGLTWILEILSAAAEYSQSDTLRSISIIADLLNGLEGLIIFIILVVFRKKVIRGLAERTICCFKMPASWRQFKDEENEDDDKTAEEISLDQANKN